MLRARKVHAFLNQRLIAKFDGGVGVEFYITILK